jgi:outer membrane protein TolC
MPAGVEAPGAEQGMGPDILADRDTNAPAGMLDHRGLGGGLEITVLIEHVVGGQEAFAGDGPNLAPVTEGGGVVERPAPTGGVGLHGADDGGHRPDLAGNFSQRIGHILYEPALEQQVPRWIAANGKLGKDDQFSPPPDKERIGLQDLSAVAGKITNGWVKLGKAKAHEKGKSFSELFCLERQLATPGLRFGAGARFARCRIMRFSRHLLACAFVLLVGAGQAAEPTLTLEQALASVERVSTRVLLSRETAAQALEQTLRVRAGILPTVNASLAQRRSQGVSTAGVAVSRDPASRFDAQLFASYSLLNFGRRSNLKASRIGYQVAQAEYNSVVQSALTFVGQSYFAHLRNSRRLVVFDAAIARARSLLELARNQLAAGVATQIDVTRAESVLALAEQARLQQVTVLYSSELLLKRLLDIDAGAPLQLADFQVRRTDPTMFSFSDQKTAFEQRADYLSAQTALERVKQDVHTATVAGFPALNLTGQFGSASKQFDDIDRAATWSAGIALSLPVFDAFRIGADKRIQFSRMRAQETRVHNLELQISSEIRLALQDAGSRNAQTTVAEKSVQLAQEELGLAQQRYRQGVADNREVVEAQNRLAIADDNLVEAVHQYNLSRLELARAKGEVRNVLREKVE